MTNASKNYVDHVGRKLKRVREILQIKQESLASILGNEWTQKKISQLEDKEVIPADILAEVATAMKITPEAITNFDEDGTVNIIASNHNGKDSSSAVNYQCTFNPIDKLMEVIEENKKLYERLLQSQQEKVGILEKIIGKKD